MPLDASTVAILVSAAGVLIAAISTAIVQVIVALRTERKVDASVAVAKETVRVASGAAADTAVILGHVNSEATQLKAMIAAQVKEIESMRLQIEAAERRAALLAQARFASRPDLPSE